MNDELWLKKIKDRLDNCAEPLPSGGWERLQRELNQTEPAFEARKKYLIPFRRWSVAAAAAALVAVSGVSFWLLQSPAGEEVRRAEVPAVVVPDVMPQPAARQDELARVEEVKPEQRGPVKTIVPEAPNILHEEKIEESEKIVEAMPERKVNVAAEQSSAVAKVSADDTVEENQKEQKAVSKRKTSLEEPRSLPDKVSKKKGGWSFGLSVGNRSGASGNGANGAVSMGDAGSHVVQGSNINLSATTNGVIAIPSRQELTFKGGMPYVLQRGETSVSADHRQPVSVGFSVRKELGRGFSVETGLMYTLLSSDIYFGSGGDKMDQKLHYLGIPLRANWNFVNTRNFTLYLSAGGAIEKCVYGKLGSETQTVKPIQMSVLGAAGVQYNLSRRWGLYVEPGVSYFFDDGSDVLTIRKDRPCSFTLQAGLRLTY